MMVNKLPHARKGKKRGKLKRIKHQYEAKKLKDRQRKELHVPGSGNGLWKVHHYKMKSESQGVKRYVSTKQRKKKKVERLSKLVQRTWWNHYFKSSLRTESKKQSKGENRRNKNISESLRRKHELRQNEITIIATISWI